MSLHRATAPVLVLLLALALAGCGERERERGFEPVAVEEAAEPLPAPLPVTGPVTAVATAGGDAPVDAAAAGAVVLPVITPVGTAGEEPPAAVAPLAEAAADGVASIGFADATLPPLEDNPEAGLAPIAGVVPDAVATSVAASASVAAPAPAAVPASAAAASGNQHAVDAVRAYYAAVRAGDLARAYAAWSDGGRASGRTPEQFAEGFDGVAITAVTLGAPSPAAGAAGARYVEVPVTVTSRDRDGRETRQVGAFLMRGPGVDGAPAGWYIASAELRELQP